MRMAYIMVFLTIIFVVLQSSQEAETRGQATKIKNTNGQKVYILLQIERVYWGTRKSVL